MVVEVDMTTTLNGYESSIIGGFNQRKCFFFHMKTMNSDKEKRDLIWPRHWTGALQKSHPKTAQHFSWLVVWNMFYFPTKLE